MIHENHASNRTAMAIRYVDQLTQNDSRGVPEALLELAAAGPVGEKLAELGWQKLAESMPLRRNGKGRLVPEGLPHDETRRHIVQLIKANIHVVRPDAISSVR